MNTIVITIIMSSIFSATAKLSVLQYKPKGRRTPAETYNFPVLVQDNNGKDVKRYKSVSVWDGHKSSIRQAIRDTYEPFRDVADECGWTEREMLKEFRSNVMEGEGKDKFDEALDEDDIDYDNPSADDFELKKEEFIQSLGEENIHWLFEVDQGDRDNMTREDIADRLDAHLKKEVEEAQKKVKSRKGGGGSGNGDSSERSGDSSKRFGKRKRGGRSDRNGGGKRARTPRDNEPCPFHNGSHDFGKCAASPFKSNNNYDEWACKKILGRKDIEKDHPWYVKACKYHRGLELSDGVRFHNGKPVSRDGSPLGRDNGDRRQGRDRRDRGRPRGGRGGGDQNQHGRGDSNNNNSTQQQFQFAPPAGMPPLPVGSTIQILPPLPAPPTSNRGVSFAFGRQPSAPATTQQASGGGRWVLNSQGVYQPI